MVNNNGDFYSIEGLSVKLFGRGIRGKALVLTVVAIADGRKKIPK